MDRSITSTKRDTMLRFFYQFFLILGASMIVTTLVHAASAVAPTDPTSFGLPFEANGKEENGSALTIVMMIKSAVKYIGILAVISLSWGGIEFLISWGDDSKIKKAKGVIMYSLLGVILAGGAYTIIDIVSSLKIS